VSKERKRRREQREREELRRLGEEQRERFRYRWGQQIIEWTPMVIRGQATAANAPGAPETGTQQGQFYTTARFAQQATDWGATFATVTTNPPPDEEP